MKMTFKIQFDPMEVSPKTLRESIVAAGVAEKDITWFTSRDTPAKKKPVAVTGAKSA